VLRLWRLEEGVLNRRKTTLSREEKRGNPFTQQSNKDRLLSEETNSSWFCFFYFEDKSTHTKDASS
tara:strand:- start:64 stop:261 length:198 start_codon:yes stop_codon:yes gene_type:complete